MMRKRFLAGLLLLLTAACAGAAAQASPSQGGSTEALKSAVAKYRALEPKLTAAQKEEFTEAYAQLCKSYQTAGILLEAVMDSEDEANANTALLSFQKTVEQLPVLTDAVIKVVRKLEGGK
jgi:hypothetical protein